MAGNLTAAAIKAIKPTGKKTKHYDGDGLYLEVTPAGSYIWRFRYKISKVEKLLTIGRYPAITLKAARTERDKARLQMTSGIDPAAAKQTAKREAKRAQVNTFEAVAKDWLKTVYRERVGDSHWVKGNRRLEQKVFPYIGKQAIGEIEPPDILDVLKRISAAGTHDTVKRVRILIGQIFRYAIAAGLAKRDPTKDLRGLLPTGKTTHMPAITEAEPLAPLLRAIHGYQGHAVIKAALILQSLLFVRPGELRHARWSDMNLNNSEWRFITSKTKTELIVPLPHQAVTILKSLYEFTGISEWVFPTPRSNARPFSENGMKAALDAIGYGGRQTAHGFRATARTILDEELRYPPPIIEQQLGHSVKDPNGRAYNRTAYLEQRRDMLQHWADYLDELRHKN